MSEKQTGAKSNQAVLRALEILDLFTEQAPVLSLAEVASTLGVNAGTAFRLVKTLEDAGYLARGGEAGKDYRLGFRPLGVAKVVLNTQTARIASKGYLESLAATARTNANLAILDGLEIVYLERASFVPEADPYCHSGRRAPAHCTALGKVLLAYGEGDSLLGGEEPPVLRAYTEHTITDVGLLKLELERIRAAGYASEESECAVGSNCLAAPVFDARGKVVAAISLSTMRTGAAAQDVAQHLADLQLVCTQVSHRLGYSLFQPA